MYPHRLWKYLFCDWNQGAVPDSGSPGNRQYVACDFCGCGCHGSCGTECHPGAVCEKALGGVSLETPFWQEKELTGKWRLLWKRWQWRCVKQRRFMRSFLRPWGRPCRRKRSCMIWRSFSRCSGIPPGSVSSSCFSRRR